MSMIPKTSDPVLSHERFSVVYRLTGDEAIAMEKAKDITVEQTVEFPPQLVPDGVIRDEILGRIETFRPAGEECFEAVVSFAVETAGGELTQLLNVVFGNISIKPGIRVMRIDLSDRLFSLFKGPRFGVEGIRARLGIAERPLLCTALKPQGLSADDLAELSYRFALGGIDIIKDDHGIADQRFSAFSERVVRSADAVNRANRSTGGSTVYAPNITAPFDEVMKRARFAKDAGAGALLISPGLTGFDAMRAIAEDESIALPVIAHPAFLGSYVVNGESGISHYALFGQFARIAGADATIFPNFGGRFSFSRDECVSIAKGCADAMGHFKKIFPAPGGGMSLERVPGMCEIYGSDVMLLVGGGLFRPGIDIADSCRTFMKMVEEN